ncbi:hypothetical protein WR25_16762 [Diploscapter pachys]|uniref:RRM domain-containing protein n=1 Tax=Diploscapter pachys TaxID=2018661 RepID=A0A2A2L8C6_9BILA|nr:hypothetical protein WR25_16762 [Diploscapter pachys]
MGDFDAEAAELELLGEAGGTVDHSDALIDENDLLGRVSPNHNGLSAVKKEESDLYEDAIAPSADVKSESAATTPAVKDRDSAPAFPLNTNTNTSNVAIGSTSSSNIADGKKYCCYVGNMDWFTTDEYLLQQLRAIGLDMSSLVDMKFHDNRINGQSRGFALLVFSTEQSVRSVMEKLKFQNSQGVEVMTMLYTKQALAKLEEMSNKFTRNDPKAATKKEESCLDMGTIRITPNGPPPGMMNRMGGPPTQLGATIMNLIRPGGNPPVPGIGPAIPPAGGPMMNRPPMPVQLTINGQPTMNPPPMMSRPPMGGGLPTPVSGPPSMSMPPQLPPGAPRPLMPPTSVGPPNPIQPPANSQSFMPPTGHPPPIPVQSRPPPNMPPYPPTSGMPPMMGGPPTGRPPPMMHGMPPQGMAPVHINPQMFPGMQHPGGAPLSEAEFEEIMNRNRTVSSSAISRAVADAASGDARSAVETLLTAISLIKQSRVAHDDRCRMLIASLQDTLSGIENKAYGSNGGRSRDKYRDKSRSRSRDRDRKRRRRSRSRCDILFLK